MVAVEVGGAVAGALAADKDWVSPSGEVHTHARSLSGISGTVQSLQAVVESEGLVVRVSEAELETARVELSELEGVWPDLAAAAPLAAAQKLADRGVVTEHGLLDESTGLPVALDVVEARVDELLRVLAVRGE
jgi:threonine synthase